MSGIAKTRADLPGLFHCPKCDEFKPRETFYASISSPNGIGVYCKKCANAKNLVNWEQRPHQYRSDAVMTKCAVCEKIKPSPEMWRYEKKWRGEPVCLACKEAYCKENKTDVVPKYFIVNGRRTCCRCKINKSMDDFNKSGTSKTGFSLHCLACIDEMILVDRKKKGKPFSGVPESNQERRCSRCGEVRPLSFFYKIKSKKGDELASSCKLCVKYYNSKRYSRTGPEYAKNWLRKQAIEKPLSSAYWKRRTRHASYSGVDHEKLRAMFIARPYCEYCHLPLNAWECQIDHKIPRSRGGSNLTENLVVACSLCNRAKYDMTDVEFRVVLDDFRIRLNRMAASKKSISKRCGIWDISEILPRAEAV